MLVVNRFSPPIPHQKGVGLARKIGNDLGLVLLQAGLVNTPWLFNTDADAQLPADFLQHPQVKSCLSNAQLSAFQYGFTHEACQSDFQESTWCYDQYLRYHYRGLTHAQSPYAYTTVGSLLTAAAPYYAAVRGFPKRAAGEDFYLLNKLRKQGPIHTLSSPRVLLSGRPSHRVPFGTGPTLSRWQSQDRWNTTVWPPQVYSALREVLKIIDQNLQWMPLPIDPNNKTDKDSGNINISKHMLTGIPDRSATILQSLGVQNWLLRANLQQYASPEQRKTAFHGWFDALKTQKFIRRWAEGLTPITLAEASQWGREAPTPVRPKLQTES
jgi:hypothetical protein